MLRMRTAFMAALVIAAGVTPIVPASAARAEPKAAIDLCRNILLPNRPESNLGECLSYITVAENGSAGEVAHHCDSLEENDPVTFDMFFTSKSECIRAFGGRGLFN
ncbi:MAG: hypothetical protein ABI454_12665 [Sphingomicrobium sp.]